MSAKQTNSQRLTAFNMSQGYVVSCTDLQYIMQCQVDFQSCKRLTIIFQPPSLQPCPWTWTSKRNKGKNIHWSIFHIFVSKLFNFNSDNNQKWTTRMYPHRKIFLIILLLSILLMSPVQVECQQILTRSKYDVKVKYVNRDHFQVQITI